MRLNTILSVLILLSCHTKRHAVKNEDNKYQLPQEEKISFSFEANDVCSTYCFLAKDTLTPILTSVRYNGSAGNEKNVVFTSFLGYVPATSLIFYDSIGNKKIEYYRIDKKDHHQKLIKTLYCYNENAQLIQSISFDYTRRIKKYNKKGHVISRGCSINDDDFEKQKSWALESVWNYKYNLQGQLVEKIAPILNSTQDHYLYSYDQKGRLKEVHSLNGNRLIWIENYTYHQNGYEFTRTWFEKDGTRAKSWDGKFDPIYTIRFKTDKFFNIIEESVYEEGVRIISRDVKHYDTQNRLSRHESYYDSANLNEYYIYNYINSQNPIRKIFTEEP